jgi:monoamine oxidase
MDISNLGLDEDTLTGIRALSYDRATKVGIEFSSNWWYPPLQKNIGGISSSDLPISNVVCPYWYDDDNTPAVLMVSYSGAQDATRMGSLVPDYSSGIEPKVTDPIVTVYLQNLAKLWSASGVAGAPTFEQLQGMYVTHHAFSWPHDPWTGGAFALFGPGQFKNLYTPFFQPKYEGKFNICGEATSRAPRVDSGALDSAYTAVLT